MFHSYIRCGCISLQVGLDRLVLLVKVRQVWHEILDHVGVRQRVDLGLFALVGRNPAYPGMLVLLVSANIPPLPWVPGWTYTGKQACSCR